MTGYRAICFHSMNNRLGSGSCVQEHLGQVPTLLELGNIMLYKEGEECQVRHCHRHKDVGRYVSVGKERGVRVWGKRGVRVWGRVCVCVCGG